MYSNLEFQNFSGGGPPTSHFHGRGKQGEIGIVEGKGEEIRRCWREGKERGSGRMVRAGGAPANKN